MRKIVMGLAFVAVAATGTLLARQPSYVYCTDIGWIDPVTGVRNPYFICTEVWMGG